ncbi:uncharacterized protein TRUGW13939_03133 [Talaromyces rugulosus]|uniref:Uncharacterized protein n=1 Tax=Talaromyces rugulosus TaxID=121627 RepID=A0A7H8QSC5_TALRU|nr:uncharacterized protein TRUGW13939_03133 [Talaromyces rugulosus]QKX56033.1 hypothetical protein TRUGW13939_03133 [Talaromyces rugulosus]
MGFWQGWQSWEKMVFILACAMVVVIVIGLSMTWFRRWKTHLYHQASTEEAQRNTTIWRQQFKVDDVPFGARALETGAQVEGVYALGQQTPRRNAPLYYNADSSIMSTPPTPSPPRVSRSSQQSRYGSYSPL